MIRSLVHFKTLWQCPIQSYEVTQFSSLSFWLAGVSALSGRGIFSRWYSFNREFPFKLKLNHLKSYLHKGYWECILHLARADACYWQQGDTSLMHWIVWTSLKSKVEIHHYRSSSFCGYPWSRIFDKPDFNFTLIIIIIVSYDIWNELEMVKWPWW
jgi:hypothetical protein